MRELQHPAPSEIDIDAVLNALVDPIRRRIVCQLADGHDDQACIAFDLPVSKSTSTHHFRVLREAGVIEQRYQGTAILNSLRMDVLDERFPGLVPAIISAERARASTPADRNSAV
ncbi:helix-turn-helix transcriptional regulator [Rhodococcus sp. IEGM 1381]|uniref:ArsR/SmtB family transcription factor n=1 Tax=Rhodococcus sp. IEGM 1381 TaxID=3047085 RepID=UPI0024B78D05|nr:helix-turn-helix transcriptional regulator [Rhodococcus sp. IEGM 1381]MDI9894515.1 helix-turn-helix transcriptional regulator [Rhodococcus sp. IEGM 1381]